MEHVSLSKNFLLLQKWGLMVTTGTNINFIIDGSRPSVVLARKWEQKNGQRVDKGLVTQTGETSTKGASESKEPVRDIVARETFEEAGITQDPLDPRLFGYRTYDNAPNDAQVYFTTVHSEPLVLRETGWNEEDESLDPPTRIALADLFDPLNERLAEFKCILSHRIPIALAFLSLERLGFTERPHVSEALAELGELVSSRLEQYEKIAREKFSYLLITPVQER